METEATSVQRFSPAAGPAAQLHDRQCTMMILDFFYRGLQTAVFAFDQKKKKAGRDNPSLPRFLGLTSTISDFSIS